MALPPTRPEAMITGARVATAEAAFCVAVVWSKDFVIHLFAVGFVAKLAKKEEWYVSFL